MKHQLKGGGFRKSGKEKKWKRKKKKKKKSEAQKKSLVDKAQSTIGETKCVGKERRRGEIKRGETIFWEDLEDGSSFL